MTDTDPLAALLKELDPLAESMDDLAARLAERGVQVTGDAGHTERCAANGYGDPACPVCTSDDPRRATGDAGLDVERLARALASALGDDPTSLRKLPLAELIAREYAALTGDTPEALPLGEPAMHAHDGLGTHRAEQHHRPEDYR